MDLGKGRQRSAKRANAASSLHHVGSPSPDATSVPSVVLPSSVQRWFPVSKDTLHEGLRGRGRATTETKEAKGNRRGGGCWRARAASSSSNSRRASCSNWFVGRSGAANKVAQIGKNETLMALIRRNASVVFAARMPRATTSNFIIAAGARRPHHRMRKRESRSRGCGEERRFVTHPTQ